jgi:4-amino-4-deoxy-L-arabinose transferase-like glycosyltransferase
MMDIARRPWVVLSAACLLIHLLVNNGYGAFSDELYFIVCGLHPASGYVDQPPLVPWIAGASYTLFGAWLLPLRLAPALSMAATVALSAELAQLLGGGRYAQWLSGAAVLLGGVFLVDGLLLTTDMMQPLAWTGLSWALVKLTQTRDGRWWLAFGLFAGIGLLSKYLIAFYLLGLAVGVAFTPLRRWFASPYLYFGAVIALLFAAPSVVWQAQHGWLFVQVGQAGVNGKNIALSPLGFFAQQILFAGAAAAPVWIAGLWRFGVRPPRPELRVFALAYVAMAALFLTLHGKAYYLAPIYPTLLAGGAVALESWFGRAWLRGGALAFVTGIGVLLAPLALPVLPPERYGDYARALGIPSGAAATEKGKPSALPLHLAGMFGWREMAAKVDAVWRALPAKERAHAVFYGRDYGEAAAVAIYGHVPAVSGHNNFFLWGPKDGDVVITLGNDVTTLTANYGSVSVAGRIDAPYAMPYETGVPVTVLRQPRVPLAALWPKLRHYD